jgi:hypothetical protein
VKVTELGYMRGVRLFAVDFSPVQYNPVTRTIQVLADADVQVTFTGGNEAATRNLRAKAASPVFDAAFSSSVINYEAGTRSTLNRYPLGYLIITPATYRTALQPFIDWKTQQGFNVSIAIVGNGAGETGTTATAIKTYLQNIWNNATEQNPAPTYALLVGDTPQIPAFIGTTATGHVTDVNYFRMQGTDFMPEMYYGRFSANNLTELQVYIDKTLQYEKYQMPDPSYLANVTMIAGVDATHGANYANGQINYGTQNYFNAAHGITSNTFLYPSSGNAETQIINTCNTGIGYINYTAHGDIGEWYDPHMTIDNINSMTNANKYFVAVGNCCLTNHFDTGTCFGEAFTRTANKGAVAYIGGTNSTYWDEDYWWGVGNKPLLGAELPGLPITLVCMMLLFMNIMKFMKIGQIL